MTIMVKHYIQGCARTEYSVSSLEKCHNMYISYTCLVTQDPKES